MVSKLGKAFLRELAQQDKPIEMWDCMTLAKKNQGVEYHYAFQTYAQRYLVERGFMDRFSSETRYKSWYVITHKGRLEIDPARAKRLIRSKIRRQAIRLHDTYIRARFFYTRHAKPEKYFREIDYTAGMRQRIQTVQSMIDIAPDTISSFYHTLLYEQAQVYVRYYKDPEDSKTTTLGMRLIKALVPREFIEQHYKTKIVKQINQTYLVRQDNRWSQNLNEHLDVLIAAFGIDTTEIDEHCKELREKLRIKHLVDIKAGTRCVLCSNLIHRKDATQQAKDLELETGIKTGVVCCFCFSALEAASQKDHINGTEILSITERDEGLIEMIFKDPVSQDIAHNYSPPIKVRYGDAAECDWRDDKTLWIWTDGYPHGNL